MEGGELFALNPSAFFNLHLDHNCLVVRIRRQKLEGIPHSSLQGSRVGFEAGWRILPDVFPMGRVVSVRKASSRAFELTIEPDRELFQYLRHPLTVG